MNNINYDCDYCPSCIEREVPGEDVTSVVWYTIKNDRETGGEVYVKEYIDDLNVMLDDIVIPMLKSLGFEEGSIEKRIKY